MKKMKPRLAGFETVLVASEELKGKKIPVPPGKILHIIIDDKKAKHSR